MNEGSQRLLVLCHHGDFEHLLQATSAAAAATNGGWRVDLVFYFGALARLLTGRLDQVDDAPTDWSQNPADRLDEAPVRPPSVLLEAARATDALRVFACSASLRLLDAEFSQDQSAIDEVVGWPTVLELMSAADRTLYL
jgi:peroxiredoxin family protein